MALDTYYCKECNTKFDIIRERWDGRCPWCGTRRVEKQLPKNVSFKFSPKLEG